MLQEASSIDLTTSQLRIWTGQKLQPDLPLYNMALAFYIDGKVDVEAFRKAFYLLLEKSDALRTQIHEGPDTPHVSYPEAIDFSLELIDLSKEPNGEAIAEDLLTERTFWTFNLQERLFDSVLCKLGEMRFVWYLNQHHLITDGWSCEVVYKRMSEYYQLALNDSLEEASAIQRYRAYQEHEAEYRNSASFAAALEFWRKKQTQPLAPLELYGRRPSLQSTKSERVFYDIGLERSTKLRSLIQDKGFRTFSVHLSLFQVFSALLFAYLYKISGNSTLCIGTPSHNRPTALFKETIGLFIELFPFRVDISPGESFRSLISSSVAPESYAFLKNAQPGVSKAISRDAFSVVLNYINASFSDFCGMPMHSKWMHPGHVDKGHALRLQVHDFDESNSFCLHFDFSTEVFDADQRKKAVDHFTRLLDAFLENPDQPLDSINLLGTDEYYLLVDKYNDTAAPQSPEPTIVELIRGQVDRVPDAIAIAENEVDLSYAQLDEISERMALNLKQLGIGRDDFVAVYMDRSTSLIVSLLGILKAGAAFVPIDTAFPEQRLSYVLEDSGCELILTSGELKSMLPETTARVIDYDDLSGRLTPKHPTSAGLEAIDPASLAYMIYTSGSTGRPKGVMIEHRSLLNYLGWARQEYMADGPHDLPLFSSVAADLTITSLFLPLISGSSVLVYPEGKDGLDLSILEVYKDDRVDIIKLTPSHLALLEGSEVQPKRVKKLIVGGEDFKASLARRVSNLYGGKITIYNEYGPTEATIGCMIYRFSPEFDTQSSVAIGRPIDNLRIYLLDKAHNPVPVGVKGNIYIGGGGLARGYHNQEEMTAEKFVDDPFLPGEKMYYSGDIGRWRSAGVLDYLGRDDDQVKVRGFRIEQGEIEAALCEIDGITESFCQVVEFNKPGDEEPLARCRTCGLPANVPKADLDDNQICAPCRNFKKQRDLAEKYFKSEDELDQILERAKQSSKGSYNCLMQYSGGKDSTFALYKLVEMGMRPLVFSFDNGFIPETVKDNVRRIVDDLGLDLHWGKTDAMNEIFVDSLRRFSNVCNGCQKVINTMSVSLASEHDIEYIFTGLSRGQSFETRVADLLNIGIEDIDEIDTAILEARKAYHQMDDAVNRYLDVSAFDDESVFERIQFIDFYRYYDIPLDEVLDFLNTRTPWTRPPDTGRSTNCLINEAGIFIHKKERGYHNYAAPYSWDVRLGHKERTSALQELEDDIDETRVNKMLREIGYDPDEKSSSSADRRIVAYYVGEKEFAPDELRTSLGLSLPGYMIPAHFLRMDSFPLNATGKVDHRSLPIPGESERPRVSEYVAPRSAEEELLTEIWEHVLGIDQISIYDNFFDLGGDSILNIQIVSLAVKAGIHITPALLFQNQTIAELAIAASTTTSKNKVESTAPIISKSDSSPYELTPLQAGMLFHTLKEPHTGIYVEQYCCTITGPLNPDLLRKAWESLVHHHPVLRTSFLWDDLEQPLQQVNETIPIEWLVEPAGGKSTDEISQRIETYLQDDRIRGFQLEKPPLLRVGLFELGDGNHRFIWSFHHIICDGWSSAQIIQELLAEYHSLSQGITIFERQERPFRDFITWIKEQDHSAAKRFWKDELAGATSPTPLPTYQVDRQRRGYGRYALPLSTEFTTSLNAAARSKRLTVNTIIQGAWALLLHFYSGEEDIIFGSTVSGRPPFFEDAQTMVGLFINTLPMRIEVEQDSSFSEWLSLLLEKQTRTRDFETSSLVDIQEWSEFQSGVPLFDSILVFENVPAGHLQPDIPAEISIDRVEYHEQSNFPISIIALPGEQLTLVAFYEKTFFSDDHVERLLSHLKTIVEQFVKLPDQRLGSLSLLSSEEQEKLAAWQGRLSISPIKGTVLQWFEEQAILRSEQDALRCGSDRLSYHELNCRANRLAHHLISQGFEQNSRHGIFMDRSVDMIVAMLAVLKSGMAYVPLDPDYPESRINHMLSDARPASILTLERLAHALESSEIPLIYLDADDLVISTHSEENPKIQLESDDLAYVIYTSGSTGAPKGVMINHGNLYNSTNQRIKYYSDLPERFLLLSSISFDSSVAGIFGTLCRGGSLYIPTHNEHRDVSYLAETIDTSQITHFLAIPSLFHHLLEFFPEKLKSLHTVIVAGEVCPKKLVEMHKARLPETQLFNEYGPTEATVWATVFDCCGSFSKSYVPIGQPIGNVQIHVLDHRMRQVPQGVPGELYLGGSSISPGYLNQPELSADRFITHTLPDNSVQRVYKTGDLVCFSEDGSLHFLGRNDEQVKIRGYRIELGEVETVLKNMTLVRQAAVIPQKADEINSVTHRASKSTIDEAITSLAAYVELEPQQSRDIAALKDGLAEQLPDYMIPSDIFILDKLPLQPNGKINRNLLPKPAQLRGKQKAEEIISENGIENQITKIWSQVLHREHISNSDNFFEVGGNSLLLIQLASKLNSHFPIKVRISDLYQAQTAIQQANLLRSTFDPSQREEGSHSSSTFFWIHGEGSNRLISKYLDPSQKLYFILHQSSDGKAAEHKTIEEIAQYYLRMVRKVQKHGPYTLGGYCVGGVLAFEIAQQLINEGEEVALLFLLDPSEPKGKKKTQNNSKIKPVVEQNDFSGSRGGLSSSIKSLISRRFEDFKLIINSKDLRKQILKEGTEKVRLKVAQILLLFGVRIPEDLRINYILNIYGGALKNYHPQKYPGNIVLYFSGNIHSMRKYYSRVSKFYWRDVEAIKKDIFKDDNADHLGLVLEPHIVKWADKLNHYLEDANKRDDNRAN